MNKIFLLTDNKESVPYYSDAGDMKNLFGIDFGKVFFL
jgi:hypothetical protein